MRSIRISADLIKSSPPDFFTLVIRPLPPVLISRYAKNHSPEDFLSAIFCIMILHQVSYFTKKLIISEAI